MARPPRSATRAPLVAIALTLVSAAPLVAQAGGAGTPRLTSSRSAPALSLSSFDPGAFANLRYRFVGPTRGGRVTAVAGVASQPRTFYMGVASGGVFKTTDGGASWLPVSDGHFAVGSIGAIEVAPSDPNIVYVGTGSDGVRSNVSTGRGVYKSTDAGRTWTFVGLRDVGQIGQVRVHPTNPDVVFLAATGNIFGRNTERGVYRTRDGGKSWQKVLYVSDSTGAADVELKPDNPNVVYAAMWRGERKPWTIISGAREGGLYKSTDGGDTWKKLAAGLPSGLFGKANMAVTAASANRVYALIEAKPGGGLYRSDDAGESWTLVNSNAALVQRPFYYTTIGADPTNADVVYAGAESFFKSTDGGRTLQPMRTPHGDNHDIWVNPRDGNIMVQANDGGANVSFDGGRTWSTQMNQPTAEIYGIGLDNQFPYRIYGAQQDNSTLIIPSQPTGSGFDPDWRAGPGCETGPIIPHPTNPDTVYASCKGQYSRMSLRTGVEKQYWIGAQSLYGNPGKDLILRFQRVSPMELSPHDPGVLYYGSQHVHRTRDEGVTWEKISPDLTAFDPCCQGASGEPITRDVTGEEFYSTLYAIRESPLERGVIWTGSNDGPFYVTRDNGKTWTNVTPKDLPPGGRVQNIEPSPHRRGSAYYAVYRYLLGDYKPYIYRTDDYGRSWKLLTPGTNGIPADFPTRVVREDPDRQGLLYAGTEFGMFVSFDNGATWKSFQQNLPVTPITDLRVHQKDLVVSTQGRAFWVVDNLTPLHQVSDQTAGARAHLYAPRDAYRARLGGRGGGGGAVIDYQLGAAPAGAVKLEILDPAGKVVRTFTSDGPAGRTEGVAGPPTSMEDPDGPPRRGGGGMARVPNTPGFNRFVWDLSYPGPGGPNSGGGPTAVPGRYTARLTVGDWSDSKPFTLRIDPRLTKDGVTAADLREQFDHNMRVRDLVADANRAVAALGQARTRLRAGTGAAADTLQRLAPIETALLSEPVRYGKPGLQAHITYLYSLTSQADQRIGRDAIDRYRVLRTELDKQVAELRRVLGPGAVPPARE